MLLWPHTEIDLKTFLPHTAWEPKNLINKNLLVKQQNSSNLKFLLVVYILTVARQGICFT